MEIYEPSEDSLLLKKYLPKYCHGRVLDMGTGSGILALEAVKHKKVQEVVAVDLNPQAVIELKKQVHPKLQVFSSDLFSNVKGKFDLIIFNPPYLPQDKGITDLALYGGKKGWEVLARFFNQAPFYLKNKGKIIIVFSSLTNQKKVDEIISQRLLDFKILGQQKLPMFEELYVYLVEKSSVLTSLEKKELNEIQYYTRGKRGWVFTGFLPSGVKVAIKITNQNSLAVNRIRNEVKWLKKLNQKKIGAKLLFFGKDYFVSEFIDGEPILRWVNNRHQNEVVPLLISVLKQCFVLDHLGINKEEMHHPQKHIILRPNGEPIMIDFERCYSTDKPHNVTQFVEFICRLNKFNLNLSWDLVQLRQLAKNYKLQPSFDSFQSLLAFFSK